MWEFEREILCPWRACPSSRACHARAHRDLGYTRNVGGGISGPLGKYLQISRNSIFFRCNKIRIEQSKSDFWTKIRINASQYDFEKKSGLSRLNLIKSGGNVFFERKRVLFGKIHIDYGCMRVERGGAKYNPLAARPVHQNGRGRRLVELANGCQSRGNSQGLPSWIKNTPASLEYPLSVCNKHSTIKRRKKRKKWQHTRDFLEYSSTGASGLHYHYRKHVCVPVVLGG